MAPTIFSYFQVIFLNDFIKNPQTRNVRSFLPLNISAVGSVLRPPSLESFANQKNLSNDRVVMLKNPFQVTCDLWASALVLWFVCTCVKPFPKIVPMAKLDILVLDFIYAKYFQTLDLFYGTISCKIIDCDKSALHCKTSPILCSRRYT